MTSAAQKAAEMLHQLDQSRVISTEQRARDMGKRARVDFLLAHGWQRLSYHGSQSWIRPSESWRFFTLAAAIRNELDSDAAS